MGRALYTYVGNDPLDKTDPSGLYTCSGGKSDCKQVDSFVNAATKAAANLDHKSDAYKKVEKALGYLGKSGEKNGVVLNPTSLKPGTLASAGTGGKINVDVGQISSAASKNNGPANSGMSAGDLRNGVGGSVVAHEARHELDFQRNGFPDSKAAEYRTELNAYKTQIGVERGLGITGLSNSQMSEEQLNSAAAAGAQRSVDIWCASGGGC